MVSLTFAVGCTVVAIVVVAAAFADYEVPVLVEVVVGIDVLIPVDRAGLQLAELYSNIGEVFLKFLDVALVVGVLVVETLAQVVEEFLVVFERSSCSSDSSV